MSDSRLITDEQMATALNKETVTEDNKSNGVKENGKKKRKKKYSQKQWERWVKYREKKSLEKKMNARNRQESVYQHIPSVTVVSNLRAEAEEFIPRSFTSASPQHNNTQNKESDEMPANIETTDSNDVIIEDAEGVDADSLFGVLSIYAASELHSSFGKVAYRKAKDAEVDFGYTFFSISNL